MFYHSCLNCGMMLSSTNVLALNHTILGCIQLMGHKRDRPGEQEHDYFNPVAVTEHSLQYYVGASRRESVWIAEAFYGVNPQILW